MAARIVFLGFIAAALGFNCTQQVVACGTRCEYGNVVDANGCPTCVCMPAPKDVTCPSVMCAIFCANGYELGADGCPSCVCKADTTTCPKMLCKMFCEFGNVLDEKGCMLCACKPNPNPPNCSCGSACQLRTGPGVCTRDGQCVDATVVKFTCEKICPQVMCMMYCPFGSVVDANGCPTCTCQPDPTPCVCGQSCALNANEKGVCQADGSCGAKQTPCQPACDGLMCKMFCPYGNVISTDGCPSCQCNPAPVTETCRCGEACKAGENAMGVCQADGTCNALSLVKPACQSSCPPVMCMMYCEYGSVLDEVTQCPTCKCNPPPSKPCVCGRPCTSIRGNGTCQQDGFTCAPLDGPKCDQTPCPAVKCALYCPNGNAVDANGCTTCRCNPSVACRCGDKCLRSDGQTGMCMKDSTCGPFSEKGVVCPKPACPSLMCNLFCPTGNALDANGCATCSCLPDKTPCKCGETCYSRDNQAGICLADGSCGPLTREKPFCQTSVCPAMRCMMYCPGGNEIDSNGCPTCRCKPSLPCPCGAKCPIDAATTGICTAKGVCSKNSEQTIEEIRKECNICKPQLCMKFCPRGSIIDALGCPTCDCVEETCACGTECKTPSRTAGICKADGTCVEKASGLFVESECKPAVECPLMKCMNYCEHGNVINERGCATCDCIEPPKEESCPCGTACPTGVCQADGKTCAVNILPVQCPEKECPQVMCMMFCPTGNAVDENGCPSCKCNPAPPACPCGEVCTMASGGSGVCQTDGVTCAVNIKAPDCSSVTVSAAAATACAPKACEKFCEYGTLIDAAGCPTCECQTACPCGSSCMLDGGLIGACQNDGVTCVPKLDGKPCMKASGGATESQPTSSSSVGYVIVALVVTLILTLSLGLFMCRRAQRKVAPAHNYADLTPSSGYVAPQAV